MNDELFDELFYRATMEDTRPEYTFTYLACPHCDTENPESDWQEYFYECQHCGRDYDLSVCQTCGGRYGLESLPAVDVCPHCGAEQPQ